MPPRVEVGELVDLVEDIGDEFAKIEPRRDADAPAEPARHGACEVGEIGVINDLMDAVRGGSLFSEEIAHAGADRGECCKIEP